VFLLWASLLYIIIYIIYFIYVLGLLVSCFVFSVSPLCCCMVVSTSAIDCLKRLVSEMTYYVSIGTLNPTHPLTPYIYIMEAVATVGFLLKVR